MEFEEHDITVGDWVAFMRDSRVVVAEVRYKTTTSAGYPRLQTDMGEISPGAVLEIRSKRGSV